MPTIIQGSSTQTVVVDRQRTITTVQNTPQVVSVEDHQQIATVTEEAPRTVVAGTVGVQGPTGTSNIPDTDALPEGNNNLYFTEQRVADVFDSAMTTVVGAGDGVTLSYNTEQHVLSAANTDKGSTAITLHESLVDPHPQYLGDTESIDGGNF